MSLHNLQAEFADANFADHPQLEGVQPHENLVIYQN